MPRSSTGTCSVPITFAPNTPAKASEVNADFSDVANMLTASLDRTGKGGMLSPLDMGGYRVMNIGTPTNSGDAVTKGYADATYAIGSQYLKLSGGTMTGPLTNTSGSISVRGSGNRHVWFQDPEGAEKAVIWSEASTGDFNVRVNGKTSRFLADGRFTTSNGDAITSGGPTQTITGAKTLYAGGNIGRPEASSIIFQSPPGAGNTDAFVSFYVPGSVIGHLGVRNNGDFGFGGGSYGVNFWPFWSTRNMPYGSANTILGGSGPSRYAFSGEDILGAINARASAYANERLLAYTGSFQNFVWGATTTYQNTTGRLMFVFATTTNRATVSFSPDNNSYWTVATSQDGATSRGTTILAPGMWLRGGATGSGGNADIWVFW